MFPIERFSISNDPEYYEAWPDLELTTSGKLICVFNECTHHQDRRHTQIMLTESIDRGRTWTPKHPLTEATGGDHAFNCPRINRLRNGRLAICVDECRIPPATRAQRLGNAPLRPEQKIRENYQVIIFFSDDDGESWKRAEEFPLYGVIPSKLTEFASGRWGICCHFPEFFDGKTRWINYFFHSDDCGKNWSSPIVMAAQDDLKLCEGALLPLGDQIVAAFFRENSEDGADCYKALSYDNGNSWRKLCRFPLPGCHRPTVGVLNDGHIFFTYRFVQGGKPRWGGAQNLFAAISDRESIMATSRTQAWTRIIPIAYDRSEFADIGYSGFAQFPDGEIYIATYLVDDAPEKAQICGFSFQYSDLLIGASQRPSIRNN